MREKKDRSEGKDCYREVTEIGSQVTFIQAAVGLTLQDEPAELQYD